MIEYDDEPIPGLPGRLPPDEHILWQGAPAWRSLARRAFHIRLVTAYFVILSTVSLVSATSSGTYLGFAITLSLGAIAIVLLNLLAWGAARTTIYTLTNRRIVMRIGIAVPKCINLPLSKIAPIDFRQLADGTGDLPLVLIGPPKLGYLALWPHAKPFNIVTPQPMLRSVQDASALAALLAHTCQAASPHGHVSDFQDAPKTAPTFAEAQVA